MWVGPTSGSAVGPDLVIAGAARAGTSYLSSVLGQHPLIDDGSVKEPNYFSRERWRGPSWYDGLYDARSERVRLDSSTSYTYPHYPDALRHLVEASPDVKVVYVVREPVSRALSHFQLHRDYFRNEPASTFGEAISANLLYLGASNYALWIERLQEVLSRDQILFVPFCETTARGSQVLRTIASMVGIEPVSTDGATADAHRNQVVELKSPLLMHGRRMVRRSGAYPWLRRTIGPDRLRWLRHHMTREVRRESVSSAIATCSADQRAVLTDLYEQGRAAVTATLLEQDRRTGLDWAAAWTESMPEDGLTELADGPGRSDRAG